MNKKLKIVYVFNSFSEKMGYTSNCLPKALADLGHEIHVIAPNVQVYYNAPFYAKTYQSFLGSPITEIGSKSIDGFQLHRLPHKNFKTEVDIIGLYKKLKELKPDIVQTFHLNSIITIKLALYKTILNYKLFTGNHVVLSVFPLHKEWGGLSSLKKFKWNIKHKTTGRIISWLTEKSFPATEDAKFIATEYYNLPQKKCIVTPIGVKNDVFLPKRNNNSKQFINKFNFTENDIICVYTGRFTKGKNPLVLAKAINELSKINSNIKALFIGNGEQQEEIEYLSNCYTNPFIPSDELPLIYQNAYIGVWPREESMSMLDAISCGLPIIVSDNMQSIERLEGNGLSYKENSHKDLADKILELIKNPNLHAKMSEFGANKIKKNYSWNSIALKREGDYLDVL